MSKKKEFFNLTQMVLLSTLDPIDDLQSDGELQWAKPDSFLDDEEEIILPDGGAVGTEDGDIVIPDISTDSTFTTDEAYY